MAVVLLRVVLPRVSARLCRAAVVICDRVVRLRMTDMFLSQVGSLCLSYVS